MVVLKGVHISRYRWTRFRTKTESNSMASRSEYGTLMVERLWLKSSGVHAEHAHLFLRFGFVHAFSREGEGLYPCTRVWASAVQPAAMSQMKV